MQEKKRTMSTPEMSTPESSIPSIEHRIVHQEPLAPHTSLRIGGAARFFFEATAVDDLRAALAWGKQQQWPIALIGGGTNILVCDDGFDGLVIRYHARNWEIRQNSGSKASDGILYGEAGVPIGRLAWNLGGQGWSGLEWAAGLPGSLGGAIYGNAGCYGGDIAGILHRGWILQGTTIHEWTREAFAFGYRTSRLKQQTSELDGPDGPGPFVILGAEFHLVRGDMAMLMERMKETANRRKETSPIGRSCGSVFKNPPEGTPPAGFLIDQAGLKGTRIGDSEISTRHANYFVNLGHARSRDMLALIALARETVFQQFGIMLELEIEILGNCTND